MTIPLYTKKERALLNKKHVPKHVAIIMDGNRRWAKKRALLNGHFAGAEVLHEIVQGSQELGIKTLTLWAFSTENWKRPKGEIQTLVTLFDDYLNANREKMKENGVSIKIIGDITPFPQYLQKNILETIEATKEGTKLTLIIAFNYGGRDDIRRGIKKIVRDCLEKKIDLKDISEELVSSYLDTALIEDPDLLIRTSDEMRVSNFLLWQMAYTEMFFSKKLWPDFKAPDLLEAVLHFQSRERRKGK